MSTSFTDWATLRTAIKDKLAAHISDGDPCIGEYTLDGNTFIFRSVEQLQKLYKMTYTLEAMESSGAVSTRVSYGRHRRLQ